MNWYVLRVYSGREKKIKHAIEVEAANQGFEEEIDRVLVPSEKIAEMKKGKKKIKNKLFFPGYILVHMEVNKETRYFIENINGVLNFVGPKNEPQPLSQEEVKRVLGEVEKKDGREVVKVPFKMGDPVKVVDGPFADFQGVVKEVNEDKKKLKVNVSIFGRPTPVELDFLQVELEK
ncbi:MAG: transcription termination/antitermination protein NusG [Candidatus Marinimicrobia bacterium]|nr:transcription termination/antitermination protein NusG [Candidatus Neomarinimicrobiota bacterium]